MIFLKGIFIGILMLPLVVGKQENTHTFSIQEIELANNLSQEKSRTKQENLFVYYLNLVRLNPIAFKNKYLLPWVDSTKFPKNKYLSSLIEDLGKLKNCGLVKYDPQLFSIANKHAMDMGKLGRIGHVSSQGKNYKQRITEDLKVYALLKEACQYGYEDGLSIVIDLLIDDGIENLGHRKSLLDCDLDKVGISIEPHKKYKVNAVVELGKLL